MEKKGYLLPVPGVIALLGVPGGFLGVAGGTPTNLLSATFTILSPLPLAGNSWAWLSRTLATSFAARLAASPNGFAASARVRARRRSRGSVAIRRSIDAVEDVDEVGGAKLERVCGGPAGPGGTPGGGGRVRWARELDSKENRWSRSRVTTLVSSSATVRAACKRSSCKCH